MPVDGFKHGGLRLPAAGGIGWAVVGTGDSVESSTPTMMPTRCPTCPWTSSPRAGCAGSWSTWTTPSAPIGRRSSRRASRTRSAAARDRGFALVLVSNDFTEQVASVRAQLSVPIIPDALKRSRWRFCAPQAARGAAARDGRHRQAAIHRRARREVPRAARGAQQAAHRERLSVDTPAAVPRAHLAGQTWPCTSPPSSTISRDVARNRLDAHALRHSRRSGSRSVHRRMATQELEYAFLTTLGRLSRLRRTHPPMRSTPCEQLNVTLIPQCGAR